MTARIAIIGAGLAGCMAAGALSQRNHVTLFEECRNCRSFDPIVDVGAPHRLTTVAGVGPGGTTKFWHNGLIVPRTTLFRDWPLRWADLEEHVDHTLQRLGGSGLRAYLTNQARGHDRMLAAGASENVLGPALYYPSRRMNAYRTFVRRTAVHTRYVRISRISQTQEAGWALFGSADGEAQLLGEYDAVIISAGGLRTPALLSEGVLQMAGGGTSRALSNAGRHYEDHPSFFHGIGRLRVPVSQVWSISTQSGAIRIPILEPGSDRFAIYIRPRWQDTAQVVSDKLGMTLSDLRNNPFNINSIGRVISNPDDLIELLGIKLGVPPPGQLFSALVVAESGAEGKISYDDEGRTIRKWLLPPTFVAALSEKVTSALTASGLVDDYKPYDISEMVVRSSAHHSGSSRMANSEDQGVCNSACEVFGAENIFIAGGAVLAGTAYYNTGVLIGSLAFRLVDEICKRFR